MTRHRVKKWSLSGTQMLPRAGEDCGRWRAKAEDFSSPPAAPGGDSNPSRGGMAPSLLCGLGSHSSQQASLSSPKPGGSSRADSSRQPPRLCINSNFPSHLVLSTQAELHPTHPIFAYVLSPDLSPTTKSWGTPVPYVQGFTVTVYEMT